MSNQYHITAVQQIMHPTLHIRVELKNEDNIAVTLDILKIKENPVLMSMLSKEDVERIHYYAALVIREPLTE